MSFAREVRRFLFAHQDGRLIFGNARSGECAGLYARRQWVSYMTAAYDSASDPTKSDHETTKAFENAIADLRMTPIARGHRRQVRIDHVPLADLNAVDLSNETFIHVTELGALNIWIDDNDKGDLASLGLEIPSDGKPYNVDEFLEQYALIPARKRKFHLKPGVTMGKSLLWFSTNNSAAGLRHIKGVRDGRRANFMYSALGLGHFKVGTWLVLLRVPGSALQAAGHYRPTFCDAGQHRWFMAASCHRRSSPAEPFGQTCDLRRLNAGDANYDGRPERVAIQPWREHFTDRPIRFEVLGPITEDHSTLNAAHRISDGVWSRRRKP